MGFSILRHLKICRYNGTKKQLGYLDVSVQPCLVFLRWNMECRPQESLVLIDTQKGETIPVKPILLSGSLSRKLTWLRETSTIAGLPIETATPVIFSRGKPSRTQCGRAQSPATRRSLHKETWQQTIFTFANPGSSRSSSRILGSCASSGVRYTCYDTPRETMGNHPSRVGLYRFYTLENLLTMNHCY